CYLMPHICHPCLRYKPSPRVSGPDRRELAEGEEPGSNILCPKGILRVGPFGRWTKVNVWSAAHNSMNRSGRRQRSSHGAYDRRPEGRQRLLQASVHSTISGAIATGPVDDYALR